MFFIGSLGFSSWVDLSVFFTFYNSQNLLPRPKVPSPSYLRTTPVFSPRIKARAVVSFSLKLGLPRRVRERVLGGLFLRFLESFFGSKVLFFFVRNSWVLLGSVVSAQELIFARRISQYSSWGSRHRRGQ
jgi:hypothetical protein